MTRRRAVILTGHFPVQKRQANILWLVKHMRQDGWHVTVVTLGYSRVSQIVGDRRFKSLDARPVPGVHQIDDSLTSVFAYAPIHPFSLRHPALDAALRPVHGLFARFWAPRLRQHLSGANLVVIESGPPLLLAPAVRRMVPDVPMVYRASDDIRLLGMPAFVCRAEMTLAPLFDRISLASPRLALRWTGHPGLSIDPVGVPRQMLAQDQPDPYPRPRARVEAVCAGTTLFDMAQAIAIARAGPDWRVHVIGRLRGGIPQGMPSNMVFHGERGFADTVAHIRHADIGLAIYRDEPGVEYQTAQSNRILLYRHFRLPIIGPQRLCDPGLPAIIGYDPGDATSYARAVARAETMPPQPVDDTIPDWSDLYHRIISTRRISTS